MHAQSRSIALAPPHPWRKPSSSSYPYSPTAYTACLGLQLGEPDLRFRAPEPPRSNAHAHGCWRPPQVRDSGPERARVPWADSVRAPDTRVMTSPRWRAQWLEEGALWAWGGMKVSPRGIPAEVGPAHSFPGLTVTPRVGGSGVPSHIRVEEHHGQVLFARPS